MTMWGLFSHTDEPQERGQGGGGRGRAERGTVGDEVFRCFPKILSVCLSALKAGGGR